MSILAVNFLIWTGIWVHDWAQCVGSRWGLACVLGLICRILLGTTLQIWCLKKAVTMWFKVKLQQWGGSSVVGMSFSECSVLLNGRIWNNKTLGCACIVCRAHISATYKFSWRVLATASNTEIYRTGLGKGAWLVLLYVRVYSWNSNARHDSQVYGGFLLDAAWPRPTVVMNIIKCGYFVLINLLTTNDAFWCLEDVSSSRCWVQRAISVGWYHMHWTQSSTPFPLWYSYLFQYLFNFSLIHVPVFFGDLCINWKWKWK